MGHPASGYGTHAVSIGDDHDACWDCVRFVSGRFH